MLTKALMVMNKLIRIIRDHMYLDLKVIYLQWLADQNIIRKHSYIIEEI